MSVTFENMAHGDFDTRSFPVLLYSWDCLVFQLNSSMEDKTVQWLHLGLHTIPMHSKFLSW